MFWAWFALSIPLRILFGWLNANAFNAWRCPVAQLPAGAAPLAGTSTNLSVIVASAGNSGSTSLHLALEAMGFRTHGTEDFAFYYPVMPMDRLAEADWTGPRSPFKACGVQAVVADLLLMPLVLQLLRQSPDTKVMLLRRNWKSWVLSKRKMMARGPATQVLVRVACLLLLCHWLPYGLIWPRAEVGASFMRSGASGLAMELLDYCVVPLRVRRNMRQPGNRALLRWFDDKLASLLGSEEAYESFLGEIRRNVTSSSFLEADVGGIGWEELAAFVGRPAPRSGRLPRAKVLGYGKIVSRMYAFPSKHIAFLGFSAASVAINWIFFWALLSAWRTLSGRRIKAD